MDQRRFIYIYSLAYPAVLGSFLFGLISDPCMSGQRMSATLLMLAYFLVQYGEGVAAAQSVAVPESKAPPQPVPGHRYGWLRLFQDVMEIGTMVLVFGALGLFNSTAPWRDDPLLPFVWMAMAWVFAIPPIFRLIRRGLVGTLPWSDAPSPRDMDPGHKLSLLSAAAAVVCFGAGFAAIYTDAWSYPAVGVLALLIFGYFARYVWSLN